jgi:hypothetical protein
MSENDIKNLHGLVCEATMTYDIKNNPKDSESYNALPPDVKSKGSVGSDGKIVVQTESELQEKEEDNAWGICTKSIGDKVGTTKRSKWGKKILDKYERCVKQVKKDIKEGRDPYRTIFEERMESIIENKLSAQISKKELVDLVKNYTKKITNEAEMADPITKPKPGVKPGTDTDFDPFINPDPNDQPEAKRRNIKFGGPAVKPKPGVKPGTDTDFDPFINPDPNDQPEARSFNVNKFMSLVKKAGLLKKK